jgi:P-type Cu+ transporter
MSRVYAISKATAIGVLATAGLLGFYFLILSLVSDWAFAVDQFVTFRFYIISLAIGFGIQIGLYVYLRSAIKAHCSSGKVVAVSGTTSTVAMISCCAHYLANILPVIGAAGLITLVGQYQVEFFWVGLASNAAGILYIASKVTQFSKATPAMAINR